MCASFLDTSGSRGNKTVNLCTLCVLGSAKSPDSFCMGNTRWLSGLVAVLVRVRGVGSPASCVRASLLLPVQFACAFARARQSLLRGINGVL